MNKKTLFTLNVNNYIPEITKFTYPLFKRYAHKIGADFHVITKRKFPKFPVTYEKLQIYELAQQQKNDWNIYIDSDAMIHPDTPDFTELIGKDTIFHAGVDFASLRFKYNRFFKRDGRNFGSCNWFTIASDLCVDLWKPLDIPKEEAIANIFPISDEVLAGITPDHLIDDYALSRNIAQYGLKTVVYKELATKLGIPGDYFFHEYLLTTQEKITAIKKVDAYWRMDEKARAIEMAKDKK
jgi:hypothetical protein